MQRRMNAAARIPGSLCMSARIAALSSTVFNRFEEVQARALKRALAEQIEESMQAAKLTKLDMARRMATSRSQFDRVLDPTNTSVQLDTLIKAASALGKEIEIKIKRAHRKAA